MKSRKSLSPEGNKLGSIRPLNVFCEPKLEFHKLEACFLASKILIHQRELPWGTSDFISVVIARWMTRMMIFFYRGSLPCLALSAKGSDSALPYGSIYRADGWVDGD